MLPRVQRSWAVVVRESKLDRVDLDRRAREPGASEKRFNLNVSINFQNLLNHVNLATPVGNLSSPSFGESLALGGAFGGFGGGGGSTGAGNRRIYAQVRLNF